MARGLTSRFRSRMIDQRNDGLRATFRLPIWGSDPGDPGPIGPTFILLADGSSYLLQGDGVSRIQKGRN
jgi:hypothetical protein